MQVAIALLIGFVVGFVLSYFFHAKPVDALAKAVTEAHDVAHSAQDTVDRIVYSAVSGVNKAEAKVAKSVKKI